MKTTRLKELAPTRRVAVPRLSRSDPLLVAAETNLWIGVERPECEYIDQVLRREGCPDPVDARWISTTDPQELRALAVVGCTALVNLAQLNNLRWINTFLRVANVCLPDRGLYVCKMETLAQRWDRVFGKYPAVLSYLIYFLAFILHRVFPKLPLTKQIYFWVTGGKNRVLSEPEALGRLICCGFSIVDTREVEGHLYIVARKVAVTEPVKDPSYGPLFRAQRIGRGGKKIRVFKLRTMHPYSEYLQEYIYEQNSLAESGKIKNDFRVTGWGRICRKYWIDELPMLINWVRGDLKLVGVRPLSPHYASLYPPALRERRQQNKPGLVPPFYADLPRSFGEILASEEEYLDRYERQPLPTDLRYFVLAMYNILFRRVRSA